MKMISRLEVTWQDLALIGYLNLLIWSYVAFDLWLMVATVLASAVIAVSGQHAILRRERDGAHLIMLVMTLTMTLMLPFAIYKSIFAPFHYVSGLLGMFAAYVLVQNPQRLLRALFITLVAYQAVVGTYALASSTYLPLDYMFEKASSNIITLTLVLLQIIYGIVLFHQKRKISIPTTLVTLFISILGFGRASLVIALAITVLAIGYYSFTMKNRRHQLGTLFLLLLACALLFFSFYDAFSHYLFNFTKLSAGLVDYSRQEITQDYLGKLDALSILIGASFDHTVIDWKYNGNPHSSFIRGHHFFGLPYLVLIPLVALVPPLSVKGMSNKLFFLISNLLILARVVSEPSLLPTPLDLFFFIGIFMMLRPFPEDRISRRDVRPYGLAHA